MSLLDKRSLNQVSLFREKRLHRLFVQKKYEISQAWNKINAESHHSPAQSTVVGPSCCSMLFLNTPHFYNITFFIIDFDLTYMLDLIDPFKNQNPVPHPQALPFL